MGDKGTTARFALDRRRRRFERAGQRRESAPVPARSRECERDDERLVAVAGPRWPFSRAEDARPMSPRNLGARSARVVRPVVEILEAALEAHIVDMGRENGRGELLSLGREIAFDIESSSAPTLFFGLMTILLALNRLLGRLHALGGAETDVLIIF